MAQKAETARVFIGYDPAEAVAWSVFAHSILRRATIPVSITPVSLRALGGVLTRPWHPKQSNEFAFSRWLVPWLCGYEGWALFADCDMVCLADIAELWALRDDRYAVMVVKHDYTPHTDVKYLGRPQSPYRRKNWSSVMLFNCAKCRALTPSFVNSASGLELHQFAWLEDGDIGGLPREWNCLADYTPDGVEPKIVHYTDGGPYFREYRTTQWAALWWAEFHEMLECKQTGEA